MNKKKFDHKFTFNLSWLMVSQNLDEICTWLADNVGKEHFYWDSLLDIYFEFEEDMVAFKLMYLSEI